MTTYQKLDLETSYHIYNRGNNREDLFHQPRDYHMFLTRIHERLPAFAELYAYCLLGNHFHLALRTFSEEEQKAAWMTLRETGVLPANHPFSPLEPSTQLRSFFSSYALSFNHRYHRTGALFERPFERRIVDSDDYLRQLVVYIHRNPETHGLIDDFRNWPFSSYQLFLMPDPDPAQTFILDLFGGAEEFRIAHMRPAQDDPFPAWPPLTTPESAAIAGLRQL